MTRSGGNLRLPEWRTLVHLLEDRGERQSGQTAFTFLEAGEREAGSLTFAELRRQARRVGSALKSRGAAGERVLLVYPSGLDFVAAFFGCLYAGATAVPAPAGGRRSLSRLEAIVADARPAVLLTTAALAETVGRRLGEAAALDVVTTEEIQAGPEPAWAFPDVDGDSLALLQYTSGSTDSPKGVMITHANVLHNQRLIRERFEHGPESVVASWLPVFHDMGLIGKVLQPVYVGCPCFLMTPDAFLQDPGRWLRMITRYRVTTSGGPNFAYEMCVDRIPPGERGTFDLSSWTLAFDGSEPIRASTLERFADAFGPSGFRREAFYPCYGLAEATLFVTGGQKGDARASRIRTETPGTRLVGCGTNGSDHELVCVDAASRRAVADGDVGEIWLAGPSVATGYWNRPRETRETFGARLAGGEGPYLRTGDLGFVAGGELFVTGRLKEVMIVRGRNHYPQDVERTAEGSHPALRPGSGAAFLVDAGRGERLVVAHEVRPAFVKTLSVRDMARQVREAVAREHGLHVSALVLLRTGGLPRTSSGKIQRRLCQARYVAGTLGVIGEDRHGPGPAGGAAEQEETR